jgi:UDP-N-acetylmuramyl pentapeptide phosphotransferase/UDP-N-acetylglucosamine-1-phosphate transferase
VLYIVISFSAFALAYFLTGGLRRWIGQRLLDIPNARSSHTRPTPRGGGLAVVAVALGGSWFVLPFMPAGINAQQWLIFTLGALLIAGVSWLDDLRSLSTVVRFAVHLAAAILACFAFGVWDTAVLPALGCCKLGLWGWGLTLLWIVGLTNAYNFMDGIDGIAGSQAVMAGLGWTIAGIMLPHPFLSAFGLLLAASNLGFLGHNWPPAKIFMGDVGSAFLGFSFAALPLMAGQQDPRCMLIGVLFVWPFVFDATFTFLRRLINRENVLAAHRSHLYQRLVITGLSHQAVTLLYAGLAATGVLSGAAYIAHPEKNLVLALTAAAICAGGLPALTFWRERRLRRGEKT